MDVHTIGDRFPRLCRFGCCDRMGGSERHISYLAGPVCQRLPAGGCRHPGKERGQELEGASLQTLYPRPSTLPRRTRQQSSDFRRSRRPATVISSWQTRRRTTPRQHQALKYKHRLRQEVRQRQARAQSPVSCRRHTTMAREEPTLRSTPRATLLGT